MSTERVYNYSDPCLIFQFLLHSHDIVVFADLIYWTDREKETVNMCEKYNCTFTYQSQDTLYNPIGVTVFHPARQPEGLSGKLLIFMTLLS